MRINSVFQDLLSDILCGICGYRQQFVAEIDVFTLHFAWFTMWCSIYKACMADRLKAADLILGLFRFQNWGLVPGRNRLGIASLNSYSPEAVNRPSTQDLIALKV